VGGAALLHDIGHPPFSHVLEPLYSSLAPEHFEGFPDLLEELQHSGRAYHEFVGLLMSRQIVRDLRPEPLGDM
jgi:HD superfamily phosphohydrolase